jgi:DNA-binding response OmpR family regulator
VRVLILEDDLELARLVSEALSDEGHTTTHVSEPSEAVRLADAEPWDAFVVDAFGDYLEPDAEYCATLREFAARGRVVVTTGRSWADAPGLDAHTVLTKPYDLDELAKALVGV